MDEASVCRAGSVGSGKRPKLLALDSSYTLEMIQDRQLERSITCRDLDGFFEHVWTVHPFSTLLTSEKWGPREGLPAIHRLAERHTMIEGKVGRFRWLRPFFLMNFILAQASLFRHLLSLIRTEGISVIRVGSPHYLGLFALALARASRIPLVIRVGANADKIFETTGIPMEPRLMRSRHIEKRVEHFVFPRADLVAGANQDNLDFAIANGARPDHSTVFRYGNLVDDRHFINPAERRLDASALQRFGVEPVAFIIYVGRLEAVKHPDDVLRALACARQRGKNIKAILAGEGSLRPNLERLARELCVAHYLSMPGNLGQDALAALLPFAAVVASPHTGRALTEAALAGAPVVAYDVDWQGELIEDEVTGRLVTHGNASAFSDAVFDLLENREKSKRLGDELRRRALDMFDPTTLNDHERAQYSKLLQRVSARR